MSADRSPTTRRVSAAIALASILGSLNACGNDDSAATDATVGDGSSAATVAGASSAEFKDLGDDDSITTKEYVGAVVGSDIYASFAVSRTNDGDELNSGLAYFCDGKSVANWFRLVKSDSGLKFQNTAGATFQAEVGADGVITATVALGGKDYAVTATEVDADGEAGLYLADHAIDADLANNERGGWIVLPDGTQRGAIRGGTTILPGGNFTTSVGSVAVVGRDIMLRAITHIIGLDKKS